MLLAHKEGSGEGSQAWDESWRPLLPLPQQRLVGPQKWELGGTQPGSGRTPQPQRRRRRFEQVQHHNPVLQSFYWLTTCLATGHCKRRAAVTHPYTFPKDHVVQEKISDRWQSQPVSSPHLLQGLGPSITTSEDYNPCWPGKVASTSSSASSFFFFNTKNPFPQTKRWGISGLNTRVANEIYEIDGCVSFWRNNNRKGRCMSVVGKRTLLQGLNSTQELLSINENESWKKS